MSKDKKLILNMLERQKKLDAFIFCSNDMTYPPSDIQYYWAVLDELGELNHELKYFWCWWKKSQKKPDRDRVLDELTDVWHFVLSWMITDGWTSEMLERNDFSGLPANQVDRPHFQQYVVMILQQFQVYRPEEAGKNRHLKALQNLIWLTQGLGFTVEDVYMRYLRKNEENRRRQRNGY